MKIFEALSSILNGNPSDEEKSLFDKWISENEAHKKTFEYLSGIKAEQKSEVIKWDKEKIWNITQGKIRENRFRKTLTLWRSIAASVAILFLVSTFFFLYSGFPTMNKVATIKTETPYGITTMVELSDGSVIYLNAGSELQYPAVFNKDERKVILSGEAYFDISKNKEKPFIVEVGGIDIKVLGTKFNVQSYYDDSEIVTTLIEGSVSLRDSDKPTHQDKIILKPNNKAVFNKRLKHFQIKPVNDASAYISWLKGNYFFEDEQFLSIIKKLERGFNVNIKVDVEKLQNEKYTGMFDNNESLEEIIDIMKLKRGFDYYTLKDTLHIINKN